MSAVIAALLGALATATVTHFFAVQRENRRIEDEKNRERRREDRDNRKQAEGERRELLGLLKLIHAEIVNNLEILKTMGNHRGTLWHNQTRLKRGTDTLEAPRLSSIAWDQSSTRIAALMENEERLRMIISGYAALDAFKNRLLRPETDRLDDKGYEEALEKVTKHQWLSFDACQMETGMFWGWSNGMLVSTPKTQSAARGEGVQ